MRQGQKTKQFFSYRLKRTVEVLRVEVTQLRVIATPLTFDAKGKPLTFHVELVINDWLFLAVHDLCDYHEFSFEEVL